MLCQMCNAAEATIHIQEYVNGVEKKLHLCMNCARKRLKNVGSMKLPPIGEILNAMSGHVSNSGKSPVIGVFDISSSSDSHKKNKLQTSKTCPSCGGTLERFRKEHLFHCEKCFETFSNELDSILVLNNRANVYIGHVPKSSSSSECDSFMNQIQTEKEIAALRKKMRELAIRQEYEAAAILKKNIDSLQVTCGAQISRHNTKSDSKS